MYFSKKHCWDELKQRVVKLLKDNPELQAATRTYRGQITKPDLVVWALGEEGLEKLRKEPGKRAVDGYCLEQMIYHPVEQMLMKGEAEQPIVLVEFKSESPLQSCLAEDASPEILAQCQFCFKVKPLTLHCKCMSASYCSIQCQ